MAQTIAGVERGSIAEEAGLVAGDSLLSINGQKVVDFIDYMALCAEELLILKVEKRGGEIEEIEVEKDADESLGLIFEDDLMDKQRSCANRCIFCFIDQLPPSMRETLYYKDDDWRLSLLSGNYVTLTNVGKAELDRIIKRRVSPLYISVHTLNPDLRARMTGNPKAAEIGAQLRVLCEAGLAFHAQIVLCPGWNDGGELSDTLRVLDAMRPHALSVAVVPVGLTGHRDGLAHIDPMTREGARDAIALVEKYTNFAYASDELYLRADLPLPPYESYGDFVQLENGVGMMRLFEREFIESKIESDGIARRATIVTGTSFAPFLTALIADERVKVIAAKNLFFGGQVNVSGLLTGYDIMEALKEVRVEGELLLSANMFRAGTRMFLDDIELEDVERKLGVKARVIASGQELAEYLYSCDTEG